MASYNSSFSSSISLVNSQLVQGKKNVKISLHGHLWFWVFEHGPNLSLNFVTILVFEFHQNFCFIFFALWAFELCYYFSFVTMQVLSLFTIWFFFVAIWVLKFFHNCSFWAVSQFEFCRNLIFWVWSQLEFLSFLPIWV